MARMHRTPGRASTHERVQGLSCPSTAQPQRTPSAGALLALQHSLGNGAVARMLAEQPDGEPVQRRHSANDVPSEPGRRYSDLGGVYRPDDRTSIGATGQRTASPRESRGRRPATEGHAAVQRYVVARPGETGYPVKVTPGSGQAWFPSQVEVGGSYADGSGGANIRYQGDVPLRIGGKCDLAMEDVGGAAKAFFATDERIAEANNNLRGQVSFNRARGGNNLVLSRPKRALHIVLGRERLSLWQVEPEAPHQGAGSEPDTGSGTRRGNDVRLAQRCNEIAKALTARGRIPEAGEQRYWDAIADVLGELTGTPATARKREKERMARVPKMPGPELTAAEDAYLAHLAATLQEAVQLRNARPTDFAAAVKKFKLNEFTPPPAVGDLLMIKAPVSRRGGDRLDFHVAAVVASSGGDYITMENRARHQGSETLSSGDPQWYFQMYGTEQPLQTWHQQQLSAWRDEGHDPESRAVFSILLS